MLSLKKSLKLLALTSLVSLPFSLAQANDETPLKQYLDCLNNQTKSSDGNNEDRIADADKVLKACTTERQAVLDSMPRESALTQLARIESHLKGRVERSTTEKQTPEELKVQR